MALKENRQLGQEIKQLRTKNEYSQEDMATVLKLERTTYATKELNGKFTDVELNKLVKELRIRLSDIKHRTPEKVLTIDDAIAVVAEYSLKNQAYQEVNMGATAEILAFVRNFDNPRKKPVTAQEVLDSLEEEYKKKIVEISKRSLQ